MFLGQSTVLPLQPYQQTVSITKKISDYIFNFDDKIGQGNFSKVYKGYHQITKQQVAIKIIQLSSVKSAKLQQLLFSQIEVIQSLNHPNILKCHQVLKSQHNCYIITELCNGGDLQSVLKKEKCLNQLSAAPYIRDTFKGLLYLGQRGIVHRDLKIANIFLHNGTVKIADFGFAKYTNNQNFFDMDIGSPLYMSPQGMIQHMYGMKTDIWAFGVIMFQLLHGKTPFSYCVSEYQLKRAVVTPISYQSMRPELSLQVKQLILKCLVVNSTQRPDAISLKNDPYLYSLLNNKNQVNLNLGYIEANQYQQNNAILQNQQSTMIDQFIKNQTITNSPNPISSPNQNLYVQTVQPSQIYSPIQPYSPVQYNNNTQRNSIHYIQPQLSQQPIQQTQQQTYMPLQFNTNSPIRTINNASNVSKQTSLKGSKKRQQNLYNQSSSNKLDISPSSNNLYPRSYENIQTPHHSYIDLIPHINYPKHSQLDRILIPEQHNQKQKHKLEVTNDNFDKISNSSWSHDQIGSKKKFPKTLSHQNINKIQNNLIYINSQQKSKQNPNSSIGNINARVQSSFQPNSTSITPQKVQHSNSHKHNQVSANQSFTNKNVVNSNQRLNFNVQSNKSPKKFGQIIKGQKRTDVNIKSTIKLDKAMDSDQKSMIQRTKTKSHLKFDQISIANTSQSPQNKKRTIRHSYGDMSMWNQSEPMNQSLNQANLNNRSQLPTFIQQKQRQKQQLKRNLICTIMQFKQAVGFLHYCRLYNRFIGTLKKVQLFPQIQKNDFLAKCFKNQEQNIQIYSRFLLTALNELIQNIRCKQIIYDGDSYKKKKIKQDKLKQVTQQYFRKYLDQTNRNRTQHHKITPCYMQSTSILFMKEHNQQLWQVLDKEFCNSIKLSRKNDDICDNFIKNFRNLCYFGIRLIQGNEVIGKCIHSKNYKQLGDAMMQNWLAQQYYGQQVYLKLKNEYFRKMNQINALKNSDTNDTQTQNNCRIDYLL